MGRGRAKAKQTKVARELKYNAPSTDLDKLRSELSGSSGGGAVTDVDALEPADELDAEDDPGDDERGYASSR